MSHPCCHLVHQGLQVYVTAVSGHTHTRHRVSTVASVKLRALCCMCYDFLMFYLLHNVLTIRSSHTPALEMPMLVINACDASVAQMASAS